MLWRLRCCRLSIPTLFKNPINPPGPRCVHQDAGEHDPSRIRNLALVAHIDSGKTTLTESILLATNFLSTPGTVDTGSTTTDFLPAERERGITIQSASIPVKWKDWRINLIDTPGHADFGMEVESASRVVDGAVVLVDSVEGVEAQTLGVWKQLDRYHVPSRMIFLNKLDRPGSAMRASILSILSQRLHSRPLALTIPVASFDPRNYKRAEHGVEGLVDLVKWELWHWHPDGSLRRRLLPRSIEEFKSNVFSQEHPLLSHLVSARVGMLENLSMFSEDLMERLLESPSAEHGYLDVGEENILPVLRAATLRNEVLPVLCGSAMKHVGTELVLDYAGHLLASPLDLSVAPGSEAEVQLLAWKVTWHPREGWMTFVRVYSGTLRRQASLYNPTRRTKEKASKLLLLYASQPEQVDVLPFGSVGVILGFKHTRTGDTLVSMNLQNRKAQHVAASLRDIATPPAVMSAAIIPRTNSDLQHVQDALMSLSRTDPSARVESSEGQLLVHGLGALHLEIIEGRLRDEWGARFESGKRQVSYREGFGGDPLDQHTEWNGHVHGKAVSARLHLCIRALSNEEDGDAAWDYNVVLDPEGVPLIAPDNSAGDASVLSYIAQGLSSVLSNSPHSSLPLTRMHIQVLSVSLQDSASPSVLTHAASAIFREALVISGKGPIMEPYITLKISVGESHIGNVVREITENEGEILDLGMQPSGGTGEEDVGPLSLDGVYIPPRWITPSSMNTGAGAEMLSATNSRRIIHAIAPLSRMLDFSGRLRALSGGHGTFEIFNAGFRVASEERALEILKELGRA